VDGISGSAVPLGMPTGNGFADADPPMAPSAVNPFGDDDDDALAGTSTGAEAEPLHGDGDGDDDQLDAETAADRGLGGPPPEDAPPECPAVAAWRVEFAKGLQDKAEAERQGKAERAQAAREALFAMNKRWVGQCNSAHDANLVREKELLRDRDGVLARMSKPGEPPAWNVVPELVDMSGKFKEGARDTSRMRQVLLKLKTHN
jgi:Clathrin light chain